MKKIRVGVIGCGGICFAAHIPAFLKIPEFEIVALCDSSVEKAERARKLVGGNIDVYSDYRSLLADNTIDLVHICTPNYLHSEMAVSALLSGKNVMCEKPDAVSVSQAQSIKDAVEKTGKHFMAMRNNRHTAASKYMKHFIAEGRLGEVYMGRCGWIRRRGIPGRGGWFTTKALSGGGPLIDLGVHMIDLAIYLMGNPKPVAVSGSTYCRFSDAPVISDSVHSSFGESKQDGIFDVEDLAAGFIRFDNGAVLQIEFSWASNIEEERNFVELRGTKAGFTWKNEGKSLKIFGEEYGKLFNLAPIIPESNGHYENIRHYKNILLCGETPDYTIDQGIDIVKILCAIYQSAKICKEVLL